MADLLGYYRRNSNCRAEDLSMVLYGSEHRLRYLKEIWARVENDSGFDKSHRVHLNHSDRYIDACRKIKRFTEIVDHYKNHYKKTHLELDELYDIYMAIDENLPIDVHLSMFIPLVKYHTSPSQKERWLDDAMNFRIIGAYAQTEMAHGSNIRGLETVAVYDNELQEFDLHSPTLSSCKWWPGGLGHTANMAGV